jgi:hypothetical protein
MMRPPKNKAQTAPILLLILFDYFLLCSGNVIYAINPGVSEAGGGQRAPIEWLINCLHFVSYNMCVEEHIIIVLVLLIYDIISNAVSGRAKRLGREHALDGSNAWL